MDRPIPLDAFDVLEPIARGGMGLVLRGEHRSLGIPVAIKVLSNARARQERAIAGFAREVRAMASLDHPAIVRVLDHGVVPDGAALADPEHLVPGSPYLVMELAHGTLDHPTPARAWPRIRSVLLTLLDALAHAHARGIVHRDLKPANVLRVRLRDGASVLKLSDFGLAHVLAGDPSDERGAAAGTPQMMAPEQFRGAVRDFGPWTDLYALGCIAYRITISRPPFDHPDEEELARLHLRERPPPLTPDFAVPDGFADWALRLLEKLPEHRFQRASDAARALLALGEPAIASAVVVGHGPAIATTPDEAAQGASELPTTPPTSAPTDDERGADRTLEDLPALAALAPAPRDRELPRSLELDVPRARTSLPDWRRPAPSGEPLWSSAALRLWGLRPPPFVARELERERCWRALSDVCTTGRARAVVLRGPSGFGKSRLAEWLCERAHEVGAATPLHAMHEPTPSPGAGLARMLASHLRTIGLTRGAVIGRVRRALPREDAATCEAVTELLAPRGDERDRPAPPTSASARIAIVHRVLDQLARERPLVVWLDDVQWGADAIALARRVLDAQHEACSPILFVLTAQDDALAARPFEWAQLASLAGHEDATELEIGPLAPAAHQRLAQTLLGAGGELAARLAERTAGHPLFLIQLASDWVERGILEPTAEGLRLRSGASADLPDDLHEVWGTRLSHLLGADGADPDAAPSTTRAALEIVALAGGRVDAAFLASACDAAGLPFPAHAIERLLQARLLVLLDETEGGDGITIELVHGLLRETLERSARESGRAPAQHAAIAAALATRWRAREPGVAVRLAEHLMLAGKTIESLAPLRAAAREHQDRSEYDRAESLLRRHAGLVAQLGLAPSHPERMEALVARAEVLRRRGALDDAADLAEQAVRLASTAGRDDIVARAQSVLGFAQVERGEVGAGIARLEQARATQERIGEPAEASRTLRAVGYAWYRRRALAEARDAYLRALELARAAGDRLGVAASLAGAGTCDPDKTTGDADMLGRALAIFEEHGNLYGMGSTLNNLGEIARAEGRLEAAEALYRRALQAAEKAGASHLEGIVVVNLAVVRMRRGLVEQAHDDLQQGLARAERLGQQQLAGTMHALSLVGAADAGLWHEWDRHAEAAARAAGSIDASEEDVAWAIERAAEIALAKGEDARARAALAMAAAHWRRLGREADAARCDPRDGGEPER